jgi:cation transport ATPase
VALSLPRPPAGSDNEVEAINVLQGEGRRLLVGDWIDDVSALAATHLGVAIRTVAR